MSGTFDDVIHDIASDLTAAVEAQLAPVLGPTRSSPGIDAVRQRIEAAFEKARKHHEPVTCDSKVLTLSRLRATTVPPHQPPPRPLKPLSDTAGPILRAAERRFANVSIRHQHHFKTCYDVIVPVESAERLIQQATAALGSFPQEKSKRFEIAEEEKWATT